jgi:hypothetical protein
MLSVCFGFTIALREEPVSQGESIPARIPTRPEFATEFAWISARALVDPSGRLYRSGIPDVLAVRIPRLQDRLDAYVAARSAGEGISSCVRQGSVFVQTRPGTRKPRSIEELVVFAEAIVMGTVVDVDGGYYMGWRPGLLLKLGDVEWLKISPEYPLGSAVYVHVPVGRYQIGDVPVCADHPGWPEAPAIGDSMLLFPQFGPLDQAGSIINLSQLGYEIVLQTPGGLRTHDRIAGMPELRETTTLQQLRRAVLQVLGAQSED